MTGGELRVEPLGTSNADAWVALFDACGCACFCRYWHFPGPKNAWLARSSEAVPVNCDEQLALVLRVGREGLIQAVKVEREAALEAPADVRAGALPCSPLREHAYAGQVPVLDLCLATLMEVLDEHPRRDELLLLVTSPSGFPLGEHLRVGSVDDALYGELVHVPAIMRAARLCRR